MSVLGDRLRLSRERKGWTQVFIARKLKMKNSSTYANWEYGLRDPDTETLARLAELLDTNTDYLTGRSDDPKGKAPPKVGQEFAEKFGKLNDKRQKLVMDMINSYLEDE